MVDIRPPVFPIGPLPFVAVKSPPLRAVLNLLIENPNPSAGDAGMAGVL